MMRLGRILWGSKLVDLTLLIIFISLIYVFFSRNNHMHNAKSNMNDAIKESKESEPLIVDEKSGNSKHILIDTRIKKINDYRSDNCKMFKLTSEIKVSIITYFYDYQFYDLKTVMGSVLQNTDLDLVKEIIVVNDGSTLKYINDDCEEFIKQIPLAKLITVENRSGFSNAKYLGADAAKSSILVFIESSTVVTKGWLEPLIDQIQLDPSSIAIPHYDQVKNSITYEFTPVEKHLISTFTWSLAIRSLRMSTLPKLASPYDTHVMRSDVFAVSKNLLSSLGGFDIDIEDDIVARLELSFRAWLCGSKLRVVPCSRVGIVNYKSRFVAINTKSIQRLTELWLAKQKKIIYHNTNTVDDLSKLEMSSLDKRKSLLSGMKCKQFDWYLEHMATDLFTPSDGAKVYGILRCRTGRCANLGDDRRLDLGECVSDHSVSLNKTMLFQLEGDKSLKVFGKCLEVQNTAYVLAADCKEKETKQNWKLDSGGQLINEWSGYCATHVTDPDKKVPPGRQILMAQDCNSGNEMQFQTWDFLLP